jgi:hypothetical protein
MKIDKFRLTVNKQTWTVRVHLGAPANEVLDFRPEQAWRVATALRRKARKCANGSLMNLDALGLPGVWIDPWLARELAVGMIRRAHWIERRLDAPIDYEIPTHHLLAPSARGDDGLAVVRVRFAE